MKRKADNQAPERRPNKKTTVVLPPEEAKKRFRKGLFDKKVLDSYKDEYALSAPYKHGVIHNLVDDTLLRSVRNEIRNNVEFTPKETDIYKIHQSGDLANLDGLDDASLAKLPSLLKLRDALYSKAFRDYVSGITNCGPLSGRKTDMAINVYTPGCYLLCHDDVIGSRRVSYILYLTDPDIPWQADWGGALRLYPVQELKDKHGVTAKAPVPDSFKSIPPAWNQLSFFAVQPGESFHDVGEVYHAKTREELKKQGGRIRMAISGWFHIPQEGEVGYIKGEEEKNAKNSSLMQLKGDPAQYDTPHAQLVQVSDPKGSKPEFSEDDLEFLIKYMAPTYLTPDTLEQVTKHFEANSSITLADFLSKKFSKRLRDYIEAQEKAALPSDSVSIERLTPWKVSRPPHKHRYLYQRPNGSDQPHGTQEENPLSELLNDFLPSRALRHWLQIAASSTVESYDIIARRFRSGKDYTLATNYEGKPRLEVNLGITPSSGWGDDETKEEELEEPISNGKKSKGKSRGKGKPESGERAEPESMGGHEVYMAGADDDKEDAAVYESAADDDNILFFQGPAWNKLTMVLRDSGALKFVKYVSQKAKGDRWDVSGVFEVDEEEKDEHEAEGGGTAGVEESEEEFQGFSD